MDTKVSAFASIIEPCEYYFDSDGIRSLKVVDLQSRNKEQIKPDSGCQSVEVNGWQYRQNTTWNNGSLQVFFSETKQNGRPKKKLYLGVCVQALLYKWISFIQWNNLSVRRELCCRTFYLQLPLEYWSCFFFSFVLSLQWDGHLDTQYQGLLIKVLLTCFHVTGKKDENCIMFKAKGTHTCKIQFCFVFLNLNFTSRGHAYRYTYMHLQIINLILCCTCTFVWDWVYIAGGGGGGDE